MRADFRISSLVPSGLVIESVSNAAETIIVTVRRGTGVAVCPLCKRRRGAFIATMCVGRWIFHVRDRAFVCA